MLPNLKKGYYKTNEINTGKLWIDGKPIYRKVIEISGNGSKIELDLSSLNISEIFFDLSKSYYVWSAQNRIIPIVSTNVEAETATSNTVATQQTGIFYNTSTKKMTCEFGSSRPIKSGIITIEYTKTTD